ncbi:hypothetical protein ACFU8Q_36875 [Streptomyces sp. NPDC057543]|uniref:hypothetical protein n=1 Tax=Streptomyces sp. NPDC057543 TaxID=3346163 RepID=UPI00368824CD
MLKVASPNRAGPLNLAPQKLARLKLEALKVAPSPKTVLSNPAYFANLTSAKSASRLNATSLNPALPRNYAQ